MEVFPCTARQNPSRARKDAYVARLEHAMMRLAISPATCGSRHRRGGCAHHRQGHAGHIKDRVRVKARKGDRPAEHSVGAAGCVAKPWAVSEMAAAEDAGLKLTSAVSLCQTVALALQPPASGAHGWFFARRSPVRLLSRLIDGGRMPRRVAWPSLPGAAVSLSVRRDHYFTD